jgi:environmental stress-induced protein Ves
MAIVKAATQQRERWRNGGGWTRTIARGRIGAGAAAGDDGWDWRLSIADIESDGPFSTFPGVDRVLVLLDGAGIELAFADGGRERLLQPLARLAFAGERAVHCALVAGPTRDFNLMWRRDRLHAGLGVTGLAAAVQALADPAPLHALHVVSGSLRLAGALASAGDTVLLDGRVPDEAAVVVPGQALLIRGEPR